MLVTSKGKATTTKELIESSIGVLIEALEAGRSEVLTAYLSAMAKFHYYSFLCCQQHRKLNVNDRTM